MKILSCFILLSICLIFLSYKAEAQTIPANLWKGIIAEDTSAGYQGMYAVASCVRNRINAGLGHGLCALNRKNLNRFVEKEVDYGKKKYGVDYEAMAKDIIRKVFTQNTPDTTKGATHYEAVEKYGTPRWAKNMVKTVKIGPHTFFVSKPHKQGGRTW